MHKKLTAIIVDDEPTARAILLTHLRQIPLVEVLGDFKNAIEALTFLKNQSVDVVFLDINMPEVTGLSLGKLVHNDVKIVFTTAHREYAVEGFELQAVDYLLKPISFDRLLQAVYKCLGETVKTEPVSLSIEKEAQNDFVFIRADRKMIKVEFDQIIYVESLSDYIKIHTPTATLTTRETISNFEAKLPVKEFLRIHRSFIVAASAIKAYTNEHVELEEKSLPISRSYKEAVLDVLSRYE